MLYPLVFTPIFKDRIWGGTRLAQLFGKKSSSRQTGESWELSAVPGDVSVVASGSFQGKTLSELIAAYPEELLGKRVVERYGANFPLLFKFLDARDDLSIQVHPDDDMAQKYHGGFGKTEMWYVLDAEPGAQLIVGFQNDTTPEQYLKALEQNEVVNLLQNYPVEKGDVFFLETGTVHAIGKGTVIAEIQQTSNITYRIFDYNRRDAQGQLRELHTNFALKAIHFGMRQPKIQYSKKVNHNNQVLQCPFFTTSFLPLEGELVLKTDEPVFQVLMCLEGEFTIAMEEHSYAFSKGDTVLIPALWSQSTLRGKAELLTVSV
jgi:mannose-6-phosphate isomerase